MVDVEPLHPAEGHSRRLRAAAPKAASTMAVPSASESSPLATSAIVAPVPVRSSSIAKARVEPSWAACHRSSKAKDKDVSKDVLATAKGCEATTKMKLVGGTLTGKQIDGEKPQTFFFDAKAQHCYRLYGQAADGIKDLDVVMKDSADVVVGQDSTDDRSPVVPEDGAVCFSKDDKASIVVSVGMGGGAYAIQIWGD